MSVWENDFSNRVKAVLFMAVVDSQVGVVAGRAQKLSARESAKCRCGRWSHTGESKSHRQCPWQVARGGARPAFHSVNRWNQQLQWEEAKEGVGRGRPTLWVASLVAM